MIVRREGNSVRLFTRNGFDWSDRYPLIVEAARKLRAPSFVIDGEAVILRADGTAEFNARKHDADARLIAFDLLAYDGVDVREQPLRVRKALLKKLLGRSVAAKSPGIQLNPYLTGDAGPARFEHACKMGLEGIMSKHRERADQAGRSTNWIKIKSPASPAMVRAENGF